MNILLILLLSTGAGRRFTSPGGSNSADGSALHPWATIQKAANVVVAGDTVHVAPGQYNAAVTTNTSGTASARIQFISETPWGANITSAADRAWFNTGDYVTIQGFTFSGNSRVAIESWGNYCRFIGNHIYGNQRGSYGSMGGAAIASGNWGSSGITTGNQIIGNVINNCGVPGVMSNTQGHGIYVRDTGPIVQNNICDNNSGIGIQTWHAATNCTISSNLVFQNLRCGILLGAGNAPAGTTWINNNSVVSNNIAINNGYYGIQEYGANGSNNVYLNNCIYGNSVAATSLQGGKIAQNTVSSNADFVNYQADGTGNYQLASGSPCINAGTSQGAAPTDYDGVPRPQGTGLDIGPYEWVPLGSRGTPSPGRSAAASQVDRSQHAPMLYALLGVSGVAMVLLVALVFVLSSARPRRHP